MSLTIAGHYFRRGSSTAVPARLEESGGLCVLLGADGEILGQYPPGDIHCPFPMADAPWRLEFPDGAIFETLDWHIESWLQQVATPQGAGWIRRMEKSWPWALLAVGLLPLIGFLSVFYLLPWLAEISAHRVPVAVLEQLDDQVLNSLDDHWLKPSEATAAQNRLLEDSWSALGQTEGLTLVQRSSPVLGANAIALPGGTILVTDQLLDILLTKEQLIAVLAHEAGHVSAQHGVRNLIQTLGTAALIATVIGDVSGVAEMVLVSAPTTLQQMQYSREFELAADQAALSRLHQLGIASSCLGSSLDRIVTAQKEKRASRKRDDAQCSEDNNEDFEDRAEFEPGWFDYLSTHPNISERIELSGGLNCP